VGVIGRVRKLAVGVAGAWVDQQGDAATRRHGDATTEEVSA